MTVVVTHISAATASLTWALWEKIRHGKSSMVGLVTGTIAGLASITPALAIASLTIAINLIVDDISAQAGGSLAKKMT